MNGGIRISQMILQSIWRNFALFLGDFCNFEFNEISILLRATVSMCESSATRLGGRPPDVWRAIHTLPA
jgi:hypothetical protein